MEKGFVWLRMRFMTEISLKMNKKTMKYEQKMNKKLLIFHKSIKFIQK